MIGLKKKLKAPLIIFAVTLVAYTLTTGGHLYSPDEEVLFRTTEALASGRGLAIEPYVQGFATRPGVRPRADGREYQQYGVGQPLLAVPLVWIGEGLSRFGTRFEWRRIYGDHPYAPHRTSGKSTARAYATRWAVSWFNVLVGAGLVLLVYGLCLEITRDRTASKTAALLYALGSLAWPHSRPFFTESCAALMIVLAWWALLRALRGRMTAWCFIAGMAAGYAVLVRNDSLFAYPGLALLLLGPIVKACRSGGRPVWPAWVAFGVPVAAAGVFLLALNTVLFGGPFASGYSDQPEGVRFSTPIMAGLFGFLFSVGKGMFFFSPALALSFLGWRPLGLLGREHVKGLLWALALTIAVPLLIHAKWQNWAGGWCWGPRHIFLIHPFLAVPIAAWLARPWGRATRITLAVSFVVGVAIQLLGSSQDFIRFHNRFFRAPGSMEAFHIRYDDADQAFWSQYYSNSFRREPAPDAPFNPLPILIPPAPIQDSLYVPQRSVWTGYPRMLKDGEIDNFWIRFLARYRPAAPGIPP